MSVALAVVALATVSDPERAGPDTAVETVVVRAERLSVPAPDPAAVRLDSGSLARAVPLRLDESLRGVAGVGLFRRSGSGAANATIQGISLRPVAPNGAGRALVVLDGVPQNDPFGGWVHWARLPPVFIDQVSVRRGAAGIGEGIGALTGVIDIAEARGGGALGRAGVSGRGGADFAASIGAGDASGRLTVMAAHEQSDGAILVSGARAGPADIPAAFRASSFAAVADIARGVGGWSFRLSGFEEDKSAGLIGGGSASGGIDASAAWRFDGATVLGRHAGMARVLLYAQGREFENVTVTPGPGRISTTPAADQYATPASAVGGSFAVALKLGRVAPVVSVDWRSASGEARERFRNLGSGFTRERASGGAQDIAGVSFALPSPVRLGAGFAVDGSMRADGWRNRAAIRREIDRASGAVTLAERPADSDGVVWQGRARLRHAPSGLSLAVVRGARLPSLNELHRPFRVGNDVTEANAGLQPEVLTGLEAGWAADWREGQGIGWRLSANAWASRLEDPVANVTEGMGPGVFPRVGFLPAGGSYRVRRNAGAIAARGVEIDTDWTGGAGTALRLSAMAADAEVRGDSLLPALTGKRPAQSPRWAVTASLEQALGAGLSLGLSARAESARYEDDLNIRRLEGFTSLDTRLAWQLSPAITLALSGENVTGARIATALSGDGVLSDTGGALWRLGVTARPR